MIQDRDRIERLESGFAGIARQVSGIPVRLGDSGGIGDHFQIVRGVTTAAVLITDEAFQITVTDLIEQHAADPGSPLWVKAPGGGVVLSMGDEILAAYRENALTFDPGGGDVQVDWVQILAGSAASTPPLKRFELTANKTLASATATGKFLDDAGATTGGDVTLHDPEQQFSGRIADDLYTGSPGFRGIALLRTDLGAVEPDRWEIIQMQRVAEFIVVEKYAPDTYKFVSNLSTRDDWWSLSPGTFAAGTVIPLNDPGEILTGSVATDQKIICRLADPDTSPPTYNAIATIQSSTAGAPLRRFEVTANKTLASATATGKFLDDAGATTGGDVTLYDPEQQFSGRIADDLYAGSPGFRGIALLRTDLGAVESDRWEIIGMERLAEFIVVKKYAVGVYHYVSSQSGKDDWWRVAPAEADDVVTLADPGSLFTGNVEVDLKIIARLSDPDTSPPTYNAVSAAQWGRRVRGTVVADTTVAASTFQLTSLTEVYGGAVPAAPLTVRQIFAQGYLEGQLTEAIFNQDDAEWQNLPQPTKLGCHLNYDAYGFVYIDAVTLAGTGLGVDVGTGPDGCNQLKVTAVDSACVVTDGGLEVETVGAEAGCLKVDSCRVIQNIDTGATIGTYIPIIEDGVCRLAEVVTGCT